MWVDEYIGGYRDVIGFVNISLVDDVGCLWWVLVMDEEMCIIKLYLCDMFGVLVMELCDLFVVFDYDSIVVGIGIFFCSVGGFVLIWWDFDDDFVFWLLYGEYG